MFASRTTLRELDDRLDAEFYHPSFIQNEGKLHKSGIKLAMLRDVAAKLKCGPFGSSLHSDAYVEDGIPFVHPTCFSSGWLEIHKAEKISAKDHERLKSTQFHGPALVFARVGTPCCGVAPDTVASFNIHGDVIGLQCKPNHDPHFVYSYFQSTSGSIELLRYQAGSTRPRTNTDILGTVLALEPNQLVQKYIGEKVRQAERLRQAGKNAAMLSESIVATILEGHVSEQELLEVILSASNRLKYGRLLTKELGRLQQAHESIAQRGAVWSRVRGVFLGDRLDSRYYRPEFLRLKSLLRDRRAVSLSQVTEKIECGPFGGNAIADTIYEEDGVPFIRPVNLSGNVFDTTDLARVSEATLRANGLKLYSGENLFFARVGTPAVALFDGEASISPNVIVAKGQPSASDIGYLYCFCKSVFGLEQLNQELKEGVQPTTSTDAVRQLQVLLPDRRIQDHVGNLCRRSDRFLAVSLSLVVGAKLLVEALIEGKVIEAELVDAQRALEQGDPSADRAILARLSDAGIDVAGKPTLFTDLDELYSSIEESQRMASSYGDVE